MSCPVACFLVEMMLDEEEGCVCPVVDSGLISLRQGTLLHVRMLTMTHCQPSPDITTLSISSLLLSLGDNLSMFTMLLPPPGI